MIKSNRFYNDPNIGAAFDNIASLFAPPSAQDTAAYATANATKQEAARRQAMFDYAQDPNYDQAVADRLGVLGDLYDPSQSFYSVNTKNETDRRAQDIESGDRRYATDQSKIAAIYGHDRSYASSTENNVRDNARAVQTNDADNVRALEDRRMQEAGALDRIYTAPIKLAQGERAYLPGQTVAATGLPAQLDGAEKPMSSDEVVANALNAMPIEVLQQLGRDKHAPTESQVQGQERRDLRERGLLPDQVLVDEITGQRAPVEAVGPDGKPVYMSPGAAVRAGAQPAPKSPMVAVNTGAGSDSGKFYEEADKARGKSFNDVADAGATARRSLIQINELDRTLANVGTGGLAAMKQFAGSYGLPVGDLPDIQAATALINQLVPAQRPPGSGSMSDGDVALFKQSLPRIVNQPGGNELIIRAMRGIAQYDAQRGDIANRVLDREITPADGRRMMAELPNPLAAFKQADDRDDGADSSAAPTPGTIVDGHRFKGGDPADAANWELL